MEQAKSLLDGIVGAWPSGGREVGRRAGGVPTGNWVEQKLIGEEEKRGAGGGSSNATKQERGQLTWRRTTSRYYKYRTLTVNTYFLRT